MIHIDIQISKYLVGTCVLSRYDSWVRNNKPATRLQPAAIRVDKSTGKMPRPVSTGAMVCALPRTLLPCVGIRGSFNVIKCAVLALHWAVNAFLSLFSWTREGRGCQEAEQQNRNHLEEGSTINILVGKSANSQRVCLLWIQ